MVRFDQMTAEASRHSLRYEAWSDVYGPFEVIEFDFEGGPNFLRAKALDGLYLWTHHGTCEDSLVTGGFHFFGDPASCCWDTYAWLLASVPRDEDEDPNVQFNTSFYGECVCFDVEFEVGDPDCVVPGCEGEGWVRHYFD